jgi:hypothetical protein
MARRKKTGSKSQKDSQLIIRINGAEREAFVSLCEAMDTSAAREIRRFIRGFTKENADFLLNETKDTDTGKD